MKIESRTLFVFIFVGVFVGIVAGLIAPHVFDTQTSTLRFLMAGLIGAFVGGSLFEALDIDVGVKNRLLLEIATAAAGAIIVVIPAQFIG